MLGTEDDARLAYQTGILIQNDSFRMVPHCNCYNRSQTREQPFYTCKICPHTDLCYLYMTWYEEEPLKDVRRDHDFLIVVGSDAKVRPHQREAFDEWLIKILGKLRPTDVSKSINEDA